MPSLTLTSVQGSGVVLSPIKSVQRGMTTVSGSGAVNVTISAVVLAKSFVSFSHHNVVIGANSDYSSVSAKLTTTTNLQMYKHVNTSNVRGVWEVIEYA